MWSSQAAWLCSWRTMSGNVRMTISGLISFGQRYLPHSRWLLFSGVGLHSLSSQSPPLLGNITPHLQNALNFFTHALPRPVLAALIFRLTILHFASRVVAQMTDDRWGDDDSTIEGRPVRIRPTYVSDASIDGTPQQSSTLTTLVLTYRQTIFISVYSHLLRMSLLS